MKLSRLLLAAALAFVFGYTAADALPAAGPCGAQSARTVGPLADTALARLVRSNTDTIRNASRSPRVCNKASEIDSLVTTRAADTTLLRLVLQRDTSIRAWTSSVTVRRATVHIDSLARAAAQAPIVAPPTVATVTSLVVSPATATVTAGSGPLALSASVRDASGARMEGQSVTWSSSDATLATVAAGVVTPLAAGVATITATSVSAPSVHGASVITVQAAPVGGGGSVPPVAGSPAALPIDSVPTATLPAEARTIAVHTSGTLQAALDSAVRGDAIVLDSGVTYAGTYKLRAKTGTIANGWITIRSSASCASPGTRVAPSTDSVRMARVSFGTSNASPIYTEAAAQGYRLICLNVTVPNTITTLGTIIRVGDGSSAQNTLASQASWIVIDRSFVHGHGTLNTQRCVGLNAAHAAIIDSYLADCHYLGADAQAAGGWNGSGPYKLENNYLEGSGENVFFGGADPAITNLVASDITIRGNYITKPLSWKGLWSIKNLLELKAARRVLIEGNVFENNWTGGQAGFGILIKSVNQAGGCPLCGTSDVTIRYNVVRTSAAGLNLAAHPETFAVQPLRRVLVEHNLFTEIGHANGTDNGRMVMLLNDLDSVTIRKNTFVHNTYSGSGQWVIMDSGGRPHAQHLAITDNIATWGGPWGAIMGASTNGTAALTQYAPGYTYGANAIIGLPTNLHASYPGSTIFAALTSDVFVDPANGDFHVKPGHAAAALGADIDAVLAAVLNVAH